VLPAPPARRLDRIAHCRSCRPIASRTDLRVDRLSVQVFVAEREVQAGPILSALAVTGQSRLVGEAIVFVGHSCEVVVRSQRRRRCRQVRLDGRVRCREAGLQVAGRDLRAGLLTAAVIAGRRIGPQTVVKVLLMALEVVVKTVRTVGVAGEAATFVGCCSRSSPPARHWPPLELRRQGSGSHC